MTLLDATPAVRPTRPPTPTAPPPPASTIPPVRLRAAAGRRAVEMELTELSARVEVSGLAAEVTLVMTFYNPHKREMQGQLLFPLPEGATVCGYGLDVE